MNTIFLLSTAHYSFQNSTLMQQSGFRFTTFNPTDKSSTLQLYIIISFGGHYCSTIKVHTSDRSEISVMTVVLATFLINSVCSVYFTAFQLLRGGAGRRITMADGSQLCAFLL
jgi:hypothetical protein